MEIESRLYILWLGCGNQIYEEVDGTLEEAIASIKVNRRYADYGNQGVLIIRGKPLYEIRMVADGLLLVAWNKTTGEFSFGLTGAGEQKAIELVAQKKAEA